MTSGGGGERRLEAIACELACFSLSHFLQTNFLCSRLCLKVLGKEGGPRLPGSWDHYEFKITATEGSSSLNKPSFLSPGPCECLRFRGEPV